MVSEVSLFPGIPPHPDDCVSTRVQARPSTSPRSLPLNANHDHAQAFIISNLEIANVAVTSQLTENDHAQSVEKGPTSLLCVAESFSAGNSLCGSASQGAMVGLKPPGQKCVALFSCPSLALSVACPGDFLLLDLGRLIFYVKTSKSLQS